MSKPDDERTSTSTGDAVPTLNYWDLSTSHVTPDDLKQIATSERFCGYAYPEGAFVSLDPLLLGDDGLADLAGEGFSPAFMTIVGEAVRAGVSLIRFDADAPVVPSLPHSAASWERPQRRKPHEFWSADCEELSQQEGWLLTNDGRELVTISRIDVPADHPQLAYDEPKFTGDGEAYAFVVKQAIAGSRQHLLALALCHHPVDEAMELPPPPWLLAGGTDIDSGQANGHRSKTSRFAEVAWKVGDVTSISRLTEDEAAVWIADHAGQLRDRSIEVGWEILRNLLAEDGIDLTDGTDDTL